MPYIRNWKVILSFTCHRLFLSSVEMLWKCKVVSPEVVPLNFLSCSMKRPCVAVLLNNSSVLTHNIRGELHFLCVISTPYTHNFLFSEVARDHLHRLGNHIVVGGVISPVHDKYGKKELVASTHRVKMLQLGLETSNWIHLSDWECNQPGWTRTLEVLRYHQVPCRILYRACVLYFVLYKVLFISPCISGAIWLHVGMILLSGANSLLNIDSRLLQQQCADPL